MSHDDALARALLTITRCGGRGFRTEVGLFTDPRGHKHRIGVPGQADILGVAPGGRALAVEVKVGRGTRTKEQFAFARAWARCSGLYVLARYSDDEDGDLTIADALEAEKG